MAANAPTYVCDVEDSTSLYVGFLTEKKRRTFVDSRCADRSAFERFFPSIEIVQFVKPLRNLNALITKPPWRSMTPGGFAMLDADNRRHLIGKIADNGGRFPVVSHPTLNRSRMAV